MIRLAQLEDVETLVAMGQRFRRESTYAKFLRENPAKMAQTAIQMINRNTALVAVRNGKVIGMLMYFLFEHFMSGDLCAIEVAWWVEPEYRGEGVKLLLEMKKRAKERGAVLYQMISPNKKVAKFYKRKLKMSYVESAWQGKL